MWFDIVFHFSLRMTLYNLREQDLAEENKKLFDERLEAKESVVHSGIPTKLAPH